MDEREYEEFIENWKKENRELIESGKCRKVFYECLPKNGKLISWKNSVGYYVYFIYFNIDGYFRINKYNNSKIEIYNEEYGVFNINVNKLKTCKIGKWLKMFTNDFKIEVGQCIKDGRRDLIIIDREYRNKIKTDKKCKSGKTVLKEKWYKYHCNKCENEDWAIESNILSNNRGCNVCSSKKITLYNCLLNKKPELFNYIKNKEEGYKVSYNSRKMIKCRCPNCGFEKEICVYSLYGEGFKCNICRDNITYPEKVIINLFKLLKIKYIHQYSNVNDRWCERKRYDFYFKLNDEEYIIETHGIQHYKEIKYFKTTLKEVQYNDKYKKDLAIKNGIKPENYIVIDCRKSEINFIKQNIINSKLNEIFDLNNIDWLEIDRLCNKSLYFEVYKYYLNNKDMKIIDISKHFNLERHKVSKLIKLFTNKLDAEVE